jgi:AAA family ATP:ADP antiporter
MNPFAGINITMRSPLLIGVALIVICYTTLSTLLYFRQAELIQVATRPERTAWFASIDLCVNAISLLLQLFGTGAIVTRIGVGATLAVVPITLSIGFAALGFAPSLPVLAAVQILHRSMNFALTRPGREMLFTNTDGPTKYQAKNFVDTTIYRGSDALSAWLATAASVWIAIPITLIWMITARSLGRRHDATR